jgi:HEAT repeat protein
VRRVFDKRQPSVKSLARNGDVEGLINAAGHIEFVEGPEGTALDIGAAIREEALLALRDVALDHAGDAFATALADSSDRVRCAAVLGLYEREDSDLLAEAVAGLPAAGGKARAMAVRALLELRQPGSGGRLADALVHRQDFLPLTEEEEALIPALLQAEERPDATEELVQLLISALAHRQDIVTERAEALLVCLGTASTDALIRELANGAAPHKAAAVLGDIKDPRALQPLVAALSHPDFRVRGQSCFALGELRDPAAVEPLLQATRDPEHEVRVLASAALNGMGAAAVAVSVAALLRPMLREALGRERVLRVLSDAGSGLACDDVAAGDGRAEAVPRGPANGTTRTNSEPAADGKPRTSRKPQAGSRKPQAAGPRPQPAFPEPQPAVPKPQANGKPWRTPPAQSPPTTRPRTWPPKT